jgi:chromosome segregation ATPase
VNRDTLNAASSRIAGNPKIPPPNYGPPAPPDENAQVAVTKELQALIVTISQRVNKASTERAAVKDKAAALANQQEITNDQWSALNAELQAFRADYNTNTLPLIVDFESKYERADVTVKRILRADYDTLTTGIKTFLSTSKGVKEQVAALQFKIAGYGDTP